MTLPLDISRLPEEQRRPWEQLSTLFPLGGQYLQDTATNNAVERTIMQGGGGHGSGTVGGTYFLAENGSAQAGNVNVPPVCTYLDDADFAVVGKTPRLLLRFVLFTNNTAPGVNFSAELRPINSVAGAIGGITYTLGTSVGTIGISTPAATSRNTAEIDFAFPADNFYALCVTSGGTTAVNSFTSYTVQLRLTHT